MERESEKMTMEAIKGHREEDKKKCTRQKLIKHREKEGKCEGS